MRNKYTWLPETNKKANIDISVYLNHERFREELLRIGANGNNCDESFKNFTSSYNVILNKHTPPPPHPPHPHPTPTPPPPLQKKKKEKKYVRWNQSSFMNKMSKAIMQSSKLRKLFLKKRTEEIKLIILNKAIYVLHFCEKAKERT